MKLLKSVILLAAVLVFASCTKKQTDSNEILIGQFGSMTGPEATFGISTDKGLRMAFDEINAKGGVKGKKIKMITLDDQGKESEAIQVVTRMITQDNVIAVIGEVASSRSRAAAPVAQKNKVPMLSPSSTNPAVTKVGDYIFRSSFIDPFQGFVMAKFMVENLKLKKAAVFRDVKNDYSVGLADVFVEEVKKMGGEIVLDVSYQAGDSDFKSQLTNIKSKNPDAVFIPGYYTDVALIAQQARQIGIKVPMLGGDGWDSPKLFEIGKDAVENCYFSNHYSPESTEPRVVEFVKNFKARYNEVPDSMAATGYDAGLIMAAAIENAPELTSKAIRDQLAKIKDFQAVTGKITINEDRNAVKNAVVLQVKKGQAVFVQSVSP